MTALSTESVTNTLPAASTATPNGPLNPEPKTLTVPVSQPLAAPAASVTNAGDATPLIAGTPHDMAVMASSAAHLTHTLAVNGASPVGSAASSALPAAGVMDR